MTELLRATLAGRPRGQGSLTLWRGADGKERAHHPAETMGHREALIALLRSTWDGAAAYPHLVAVDCKFFFERPASHYGTGRNANVLKTAAPSLWRGGTPDVDKCLRLVLDALTYAGVIVDDRDVALVRGSKLWHPTSGTLVVVSEVSHD